jgi:hypothetical protein
MLLQASGGERCYTGILHDHADPGTQLGNEVICIVVHIRHQARRQAGSPDAAFAWAAHSIGLRAKGKHWSIH